MSEDRLKEFIDNNRDEFDDEMPSSDLWAKIEGDLPVQRRMVSLSRAVSVAAAVIVLVGAGIWFFFAQNEQPIPSLASNDIEAEVLPIGLSDLGPEFAEIESYYVTEVNHRLEQLNDYEVDEELLVELDFLQKEFEELKQEMGHGADRRRILEAMIENYRLRLEILEDMLEELKEQNNGTHVQKVA